MTAPIRPDVSREAYERERALFEQYQQEKAAHDAQQRPSTGTTVKDLIRLFSQGRTGGLADEALGNVRGALGMRPGESQIEYAMRPLANLSRAERAGLQESNTVAERDAVRGARERQGKLGTAVEIAGGLMGAKDLPAPAAATAGGRVTKAVLGGTAAGSVAGAGYGETPDEKLRGAIGGGLSGAVFGGFGQAAAEGLAALRVPGARMTKAQRIITETLGEDGVTPAAAATAARQVKTSAPVTFADFAGENTRRITDAATMRPSAAGGELRTALANRGQNAGDRFGEMLDDVTGTQRMNVNDMKAALQQYRKKNAGPLFESAAKSGPVADARLVDLARVSPEAQTAYAKMTTAATRRNVPVPSFEEFVNGAALDARAAHWWKLEMDGIAGAARKQAATATEGMTTTTAAQIKEDAGALRDILADAIPDYGKALAEYRRLSENLRAFTAGAEGTRRVGGLDRARAFVEEGSDNVETLMRNLPDEAKPFYRQGAAESVRRSSEKLKDGADRVERFVSNDRERQKFMALLQDKNKGADLLSRAEFEQQLRQTERAMQGSPTFPRAAAQERLEGKTGFLRDAQRQGSFRAAGTSKLADWLANRQINRNAEGIAQEMRPRSTADLAKSLEALQAMLDAQAARGALAGQYRMLPFGSAGIGSQAVQR